MNLQRLFSSIALFGFRHWKVNVILVICLVALAYPLLRDIQFESIIPGLESARDPQSRFFAANMERFGESGPLVIHLSYGGLDLPTVNRFTDKLAEELRFWKDILYVDAKVYDENSRRLQAVMLRAALANMDDESAKAFIAKFSPAGMERELKKTRKKLIAADDPSLREHVAADVLNIGEVIRAYFQSRMGNLNLNAASEYFDADGHDSRLVFVQPAGTADDTNFCVELMDQIDSLLRDLKASLPGAAPIRISYAGKYAISAEAAQALKREMKHITLLAAGLLLLIVWIAFRRIRVVGICFIPLAVSLLAVSLIAALFFSPLNYVAITFAAVIIGLGIDLMIHCTARFYQIIESVLSPGEAVRKTLTDCGPPLVIGFSTTAAAFLCLSITDYRAIAQFGQLTSIGLIVSLVVSLLFFPTAIRILGPRKKSDFKSLRFQGFPERIYTFSLSKPVLAVSIAGLLAVGGVLLARRFSFEMNLMKLLPRNTKALETARDIDRLYGVSFTLNLQFVIQGDSQFQARTAQKALDRKLALLVENDKIASFEPPSLFLPYPAGDQNSAESPRYVDTVIVENRALFFELLRKHGFKHDPRYEDYYDLLESASRQDTSSISQLLDDEEVGSRLKKHVAVEGDKVFLQTYVWPRSDLDDQAVVQKLFDEFEDFPLPPGIALHKLSILRVFDSINSRIRSDFIRVSALGLTMVVLFLLVFFRRLSSTLLCILPVATAVPVTLGFVVLTRIPFTPAEIGTAALILGIGIDDAVHLVSRTRLQERRRMGEVVAEIGPVLTLTSLTTVAGFGSLMIARNIVTFTLGAVITFGILACLVFTLLLIPSVHRIMKKS